MNINGGAGRATDLMGYFTMDSESDLGSGGFECFFRLLTPRIGANLDMDRAPI